MLLGIDLINRQHAQGAVMGTGGARTHGEIPGIGFDPQRCGAEGCY